MKNLEGNRPDCTKNWLKEKKLRETRIRNIREVEELKRAQEMRIDGFSRHELRESHATIQELTSQIQEVQERMNYLNESRECQDVESICSGKLSNVFSQPAIVPSLGGMLSSDRSLRPETWKLPIAIHWRDQGCKYDLGCAAGKPHGRLLEYRRKPRLVRCVDRFHTIHNTEWKNFRRIYMVRWAADKETNNIKARSPVARDMEKLVRWSATKRKNKRELSRNQSIVSPDADFKETDTSTAVCIEKVVVMNSGEEFFNKVYESARSPQRIVLEPALHDGRQDTASIEERASNAHSRQCRETCSGEIDYRIQGLPYHTVQQEDHTRKEAVKKLIHQQETHPNREALNADMRQNYAYNPFSENSHDMIRSMGNVEYSEMCEVSPKIQCPHCLTYWTKRHCILYLRNLLVSYRQIA